MNSLEQTIWEHVYDGCYVISKNKQTAKAFADRAVDRYKKNKFHGSVPELMSGAIHDCQAQEALKDRRWKPNLWVCGNPSEVKTRKRTERGYQLSFYKTTDGKDEREPEEGFEHRVVIATKAIIAQVFS